MAVTLNVKKSKFKKLWQDVERVEALQFVQQAQAKAQLQAELSLPFESWELDGTPGRAIERADRQQKRNLLFAAQFGKLVLRLDLPESWKAEMRPVAERHFNAIHAVVHDTDLMDIWTKNGLLTIADVVYLQNKFDTYTGWENTSSDDKEKYIEKIFNLSEAGAGFLLKEELEKSVTGKGINLLTNVSATMLASSVQSKQGWNLALDAALSTNALGAFCNLTLTYLGHAFPSVNWIKWKYGKTAKAGKQAYEWAQASAQFTDEKLRQMSVWVQEKLTGKPGVGMANFFTGFLYLCCQILMFLAAPYLALGGAWVGSVASASFLAVGLNVGMPVASLAANLYGSALSAGFKQVFSMRTASAIWNLTGSNLELTAMLAILSGVTGVAVSLAPTFVLYLLSMLWAAASYPFELVTGVRLKSVLYYLMLGVGIPVGVVASGGIVAALASTEVFYLTAATIVNVVTTQLVRTSVLRLGLTIASQVSFLGIHYLRNGFMDMLRRRLNDVNNKTKQAKIYLFLMRWGSVIDAVFYLALVTGTGMWMAQDAYTRILDTVSRGYAVIKPGLTTIVGITKASKTVLTPTLPYIGATV